MPPSVLGVFSLCQQGKYARHGCNADWFEHHCITSQYPQLSTTTDQNRASTQEEGKTQNI